MIVKEEARVIIEQLKPLGLTPNESLVYLFILEHVQVSPGMVAETTRINRANCYVLIKSLRTKGFVTRTLKGKRYLYSVNNPTSLLSLIEGQFSAAKMIVPLLELRYQNSDSKPGVKIYEGLKQVKEVWEEALECKEIFGIASTEKLFELDAAYFKNFTKKLHNKQIFLKDILTHESGNAAAQQNKEIMGVFYDYKLLPQRYGTFPVDILIMEDTVALVSFGNTVHATVIKDGDLAKTFKVIFSVIWNSI